MPSSVSAATVDASCLYWAKYLALSSPLPNTATYVRVSTLVRVVLQLDCVSAFESCLPAPLIHPQCPFCGLVSIMRPFTIVSAFLALAVQPIVAAPMTDTIPSLILERATAPPPCKRVLDPAPTANETAARFNTFAQAFVGAPGGKKNITKAFEFIAEDYIVRCVSISCLVLCCGILSVCHLLATLAPHSNHRLHRFVQTAVETDTNKNHNPLAKNGAAAAWAILSPIWQQTSITYLRSTIKTEQTPVMSWVNYRAGGIGEVVDRFRWEGGCIVEHVSSCLPCLRTGWKNDANVTTCGSGIRGRSILLSRGEIDGMLGECLVCRRGKGRGGEAVTL